MWDYKELERLRGLTNKELKKEWDLASPGCDGIWKEHLNFELRRRVELGLVKPKLTP